MNPQNPLFQKCLIYLESLPNLQVTVQGEPYSADEVLADGHLTITTFYGTVNYVCEIETGLTNDVVEQVVEYFANLGERLKKHEQRPLLITYRLSDLVVERLLEKNLEFIDVDGNLYLNSPVNYILVRHQVAKDNTNKSLAITAEALQVIYALLKQPRLMLEDDHKRIAYVSGVTSKTVKSTLEKLQELKYIRSRDKGYEIIDYVKILERCELGYSEILRAKLLIGTFNPVGKRNFSEIEAQIIELAPQYGYLIGGELAAAIMTQHLCPVGATVHLNKNSNALSLAVKLKLKPDPEGDIILLQNFGYYEDRQDSFEAFGNNLVHPLLIHAELVHTGNSRLKETAQLIYARYIEGIAQQNDG